MTDPEPARRLLMAHSYLSDRADLTASSEASSSLAVGNLQLPAPTDWWRSASGDAETAYVTVHLPTLTEYGSSIGWNLVAPLYTNSGPDAEWRVVSAAALLDLPDDIDVRSGSWAWDSDLMSARPALNMDRPGEPEWRHAFTFLGDDVLRTEEWVRVFWRDPSPLGGGNFAQWGRLYVAQAYRPSYSRDSGAELTAAAERPRKGRTQGGNLRVGAAAKPREFRFNVGFLAKAEALSTLYEFDRIAGASGDVLVIDDPESEYVHRGMIYGYLTPAGIRHQDFDTYTRSYFLEEG